LCPCVFNHTCFKIIWYKNHQRMNTHGYELLSSGWISYLGMLLHIHTNCMEEQQQIYMQVYRSNWQHHKL
ncbi:MAG: hypothetical protein ACLT5W_08500, partial [Ruminococcus sp.]